MLDTKAIERLARLRREWETAADGIRLADIQGSVGMILEDVAGALELDPMERMVVLGEAPEAADLPNALIITSRICL